MKSLRERFTSAALGFAVTVLLVCSGTASPAQAASAYKRYADLPGIVAVSPDGSAALFATFSQLVPQDTNTARDVYLKNLTTGTVALVSRGPAGTALGGRLPDRSDARLLSTAGKYVVIESSANISGSVTDGRSHLYRVDMTSGTASLIDISTAGASGTTANPAAAGISNDGSKVAFVSASRLAAADSNNFDDLYVRDFFGAGTTRLLSVSSSGAAIGSVSPWASLSGDGRAIVFSYFGQAYGSPLNSSWALYWRTLSSSTVTRISGNGAQGQPPISLAPLSISSDGTQVAYATEQSFSSQDTNNDVDVYVWRRSTGAHTWVTQPRPGAAASPATRVFPDVSFSGTTLVLNSNVPLSATAAASGAFTAYHWDPASPSVLTTIAPNPALGSATHVGNTPSPAERRSSSTPDQASGKPNSEHRAQARLAGATEVTLSAAERQLLRLIANSPAPLAMSDYFILVNPVAPEVTEGHPDHEAWVDQEIEWHGVATRLLQANLVYVISPANGERPDLVGVTGSGYSALAGDP